MSDVLVEGQQGEPVAGRKRRRGGKYQCLRDVLEDDATNRRIFGLLRPAASSLAVTCGGCGTVWEFHTRPDDPRGPRQPVRQWGGCPDTTQGSQRS